MYECFAYVRVCLHHVDVHGGDKKALDSLELGVMVAVSYHVSAGSRARSPGSAAASALNHLAISPAPRMCLQSPSPFFIHIQVMSLSSLSGRSLVELPWKVSKHTCSAHSVPRCIHLHVDVFPLCCHTYWVTQFPDPDKELTA